VDELLAELHRLGREQAPSSLGRRVLEGAGLADQRARMSSPIGDFWVLFNSRGLRSLVRVDRILPAVREVELPAELAQRLEAALRGRRAELEFDLRGRGEFERLVLAKTVQIPYGEVRSYAWVAAEIGRPGAVRAVGTALGHNPIPIFIPCHRVVRSDWSIGQYSGGGPKAKRALLLHEGVKLDWLGGLGRRGVRVLGDPSGTHYCLPVCARVAAFGLPPIEFSSADLARAAGYEPCPACRPGGSASGLPGQPRE